LLEEIVIHVSVLEAVQPQPLGPVSATLPCPPAPAKFLLVGEMEKTHPVPLWMAQKVCPASVIFPVRPLELVFFATV